MIFHEPMWNPFYLTMILSCDLCFKYLFNGKIYGQENIPHSGAFIVAPNHLSHLDPPCIGAAFRKRELLFIARKSLFKRGFWNFLFSRINVIPLDKDNAADISAIKQALFYLKNGYGVTVFPEGTRSLNGDFLTAQPGLGFLACKTRVPVVPVRMFGTFHILQKNTIFPDFTKSATIVIGKPVLPCDYDIAPRNKNRYQLTSEYILEKIKLIKNPRISAKKAKI